MLINLLDNALIQGLLYGGAAIGLAMSFRVLRYPDLTADGSFLIGAVVIAAGLNAGVSWPILVLLSTFAGAACGSFTGIIHFSARVNRLLSGILTSMICYSLAFHFLGARATVSLTSPANPFELSARLDRKLHWGLLPHPVTLSTGAICAGLVVLPLARLLKSDLGLHLRAVGSNPRMLIGLGRRQATYMVLGLAGSNALTAWSGALVASHQQFVDVNMGVGIVVTLTAAVAIGERTLQFLNLDPTRQPAVRAASGLVGMIVYYTLYLLVLRLSIQGWLPLRIEPSDIKLVSALLVIAASLFAGRDSQRDDELLPI
jgi:putative tryptophan/tyrosine transport system permease protein